MKTWTKEEYKNCICSDFDKRGWSVCGVPCPEHNKCSKDELKLVQKERKIVLREMLKKIKDGVFKEEIPF